MLIPNHYGLDGSNTVQRAIDAGIDRDTESTVPPYNRPMAEAAGGVESTAADRFAAASGDS